MPPLQRFPAGPVTPHGAYHILHDRIPQMSLSGWDETTVFNMLGGLSIADKYAAPGRVEIKGLKGLIAPWRAIKQKGATQDGDTFVTALYDGIEVEMDARVVGKDPADCRRVARVFMDSIDAIKTSRLAWFTFDMGYWWSDIRWLKTPVDPVGNIHTKSQDLSLRLHADSAFWQSFPSVDSFMFTYAADSDDFEAANDTTGLGTGWTIAYSGSGTGVLQRVNGQIDPSLHNGRTAVARKATFTGTTNNQIVDIQIGTIGQWWGFAPDAAVDIWARMNTSGTPGTSGIRLRIERHQLWLSYFKAGVETLLRHEFLIIPPQPGEGWRLIVGQEGDERIYTVVRGSAVRLVVKEIGTDSLVGAGNRGAGVGFWSNGVNLAPAVRAWSVGDNSTVSQSTLLTRFNGGDQNMFDDYICWGPGTFRFWNGPNAGPDEFVEFGPLMGNQVMYVRSNPNKRAVVDMTTIPNSPQVLTQWQAAILAFENFANGNNSSPLLTSILSSFGILPPQGNPYSLLKGRWSDAAAIPPKSPGKPVQPYHVRVAIDDGNANSKIVATGIPLRRMPY